MSIKASKTLSFFCSAWQQWWELRWQGHGEAAVQLHRPHRHVDTGRGGQARHPQRHLPVHHGPLSLLPREQAGLAELHTPQPLAQRLLRQGDARRQAAGQGRLLDPRPRELQHVRQWYAESK